MEDVVTEAMRERELDEARINEALNQRKSKRVRSLVMLAFSGITLFALVTFLFGPFASAIYFPPATVALVKGGSQFFAVIFTLYAAIQFYLEFGSIQLRSVNLGPVRLSGASWSAYRDQAISSATTPPDLIPASMPSSLDLGAPTIPPSFDDPSRLAGLLVRRLEEEIGAQSRRANANLGLGIVAAITGLAFLGWLSIITADELLSGVRSATIPVNAMLYWGSFTAKLSLSLAANLFAFFFFASYRRNLSEVRYFHNELTNIQARFVAVGLTNPGGPAELRKMAIKSLIDLERNFVLRKGETTAEVAMRQYDKDDLVTLTSLMLKASQMPNFEAGRTAPTRGNRAIRGE